MASGNESGSMTLFKGALSYLWEEIKTMNRKKMRAMSKMAVGYFRMRFGRRKESRPLISLRHP